jgi:citrate lyase beta subunit
MKRNGAISSLSSHPSRKRGIRRARPANYRCRAAAEDDGKAALELDHVFLDLEDAVAPGSSPARGMIVDALNTLEWKPRTLCCACGVETQWCHDDIIK